MSEPTVSVIICTRDRPAQLELCLRGVAAQTHKPLEVVVVDSVPRNSQARMIALDYGARYVIAPRPGAGRARNRGAREARGDILAYVDDDALPEPNWLEELLHGFEDGAVAAVMGRAVAFHDDPEMRQLCALLQGSEADQVISIDRDTPHAFEMAAFGGAGNGMNMAFRRSLLKTWRGFEERLGPGLPLTGEELLAYAEWIDGGHRILYLPSAVVRHPTHGSPESLRSRYLKERSRSTGFMMFLFATMPQHRMDILKYAVEAMLGVKRSWRPAMPAGSASIFPRWRIWLAYLAGPWMFLRAMLAAEQEPADAEGKSCLRSAGVEKH